MQGAKLVDNLARSLYNTYIDSKEQVVQYTLITATGRIMQFYQKSVAELYQSLNGGVVTTQQILVDETAKV